MNKRKVRTLKERLSRLGSHPNEGRQQIFSSHKLAEEIRAVMEEFTRKRGQDFLVDRDGRDYRNHILEVIRKAEARDFHDGQKFIAELSKDEGGGLVRLICQIKNESEQWDE